MQHKVRRRVVSAITRAICLQSLFVLCCLQSNATPADSHILFRPDVSTTRRDDLANKLRAISGWQDLKFDEAGALRLEPGSHSGGSKTARDLLSAAVSGERFIVLEDASNRRDVVFCSVTEARWTNAVTERPPAYIVLIDFADFSHVMGDRPALEAFNVGWAVLHEIEHVVSDSVDPVRDGDAGECESAVNQMRRECGMAERLDYHFAFLPGVDDGYLPIKLVRLAFEHRQPQTNKKKRYWLVWDANLVGGLKDRAFIAGYR